jgi:hypothetical protein
MIEVEADTFSEKTAFALKKLVNRLTASSFIIISPSLSLSRCGRIWESGKT